MIQKCGEFLVDGRVAQPGGFVIDVKPSPLGTTIRVDNSGDLAFWLEIHISMETLVRMLRDVVEAEAEADYESQ